MRPVVIRQVARDEIAEAFEWYRVRSTDAASDFLTEVDRVLAEIQRDPERFLIVHGRLRRVLLRRFPYAVYFKIYERSIAIVGVIHGHRHPDAWLRRAVP